MLPLVVLVDSMAMLEKAIRLVFYPHALLLATCPVPESR